MIEFETENQKAHVVINCAPYKTGIKLKKVLLSEIRKNPIGLKILADKKDVLNSEIDTTQFFDFLKNCIIDLETSDDIENTIFECFQYCIWNNHKITEQLFNDIPESREDYYELKIKCVEENLRPFLKSLASGWKIIAPKIENSQVLPVVLAQMSK